MSWWGLKPRKQIKFWSSVPCDRYFPVRLLKSSSSETRLAWFWIFEQGTDLRASVSSFIKWEWYPMLLLAIIFWQPAFIPLLSTFIHISEGWKAGDYMSQTPLLSWFLVRNQFWWWYVWAHAKFGSWGFSRGDVSQRLLGFSLSSY